MWKILITINKSLIFAIPIALISGFITGIYINATSLKTLIIPLTFLMVYPMMVSLKIKKVFTGGDTKVQLLTQFINFLLIPFFTYAVGMFFFSESPYLLLGLLLAGLLPTSGMTISWTGFAKGNVESAVKMTIFGLILGSLVTPLYIKKLLGATIPIDYFAVLMQIIYIVFIPMVLGYATQRYLLNKYGQKHFQERMAAKFPAVSTLGVLGIVFIAMALKAKAVADSPQLLLNIMIPVLLIYLVNYFVSTIVGRLALDRGQAIALVYGTVMRNLSIALALAINTFGAAGSDAALVICAAYIVQVQSAAWYVKFTDKIFGAA